MTQEEKDLLLKDLCARLPYNTKVHGVYAQQKPDFDTESDYIEYIEIDGILSLRDIEWIQMCAAEVKPYLFPLSSMTEEQREEWYQYCFENENKTIGTNVDWLNKNHFDYRGLIEKGLAIDATNLNIY